VDNPVVDLKLSQVMQWIIVDGRQRSRVGHWCDGN